MNVIIFSVESHDGIIDIVHYFNANGKVQKADLSKLKLKRDSVDFGELAKTIERQIEI